MAEQDTQFESPHFRLEELADGVYAAVARMETGQEFANSGLVDLGEEVIAFDSFMIPQAARDLVRLARERIGKPVRWLVNSHMHSDHIHGNNQFPADTIIVSTHTTREMISANFPQLFKELKSGLPGRLRELQSMLDLATDPGEKQRLTISLTLNTLLRKQLGDIKMRAPEMTFDGEMALHGSERRALLLSYGKGHTDSDAFLYLPDDGIIFMGDLLFIGRHPYTLDGYLDDWRAVLTRIKALGAKMLVPGHGPVGTLADVDTLIRYFDVIEELAEGLAASGATLDEARRTPVPDAFKDWVGMSFETSMERLVQKAAGTGQ